MKKLRYFPGSSTNGDLERVAYELDNTLWLFVHNPPDHLEPYVTIGIFQMEFFEGWDADEDGFVWIDDDHLLLETYVHHVPWRHALERPLEFLMTALL